MQKDNKILYIDDLKSGMNRVNLEAKIIEASKLKEIIARGKERRILELIIEDKTGSIKLVLWDEKSSLSFKVGDTIKIFNGFVSSYRGEWRINVGKYGDAIINSQ